MHIDWLIDGLMDWLIDWLIAIERWYTFLVSGLNCAANLSKQHFEISYLFIVLYQEEQKATFNHATEAVSQT